MVKEKLAREKSVRVSMELFGYKEYPFTFLCENKKKICSVEILMLHI